VRLLAAEYVEPEVLARSIAAVRGPIEESYAALDVAEALAPQLPHRTRMLKVNHRFARTWHGWRRPRPSSGMQQPGEDDRVQRGALVELLVGSHDVAEQGVGGPEFEDQIGEIWEQVAAGSVGSGKVDRRGHDVMVRASGRSDKWLRQGADICR
jgi:hypothetical protein